MLNATERRRLHQRAPAALLDATVQDPPLSADGWLRVELDSMPGQVFECPWPRVPGEPAPVEDDAAAVQESDGGNYWVVAWWRNGEFPDAPTGGGGDVTQAELDAETTARTDADTAEATARAAADAFLQPLSQKNQPNGYAGLDGSGKLQTAALPALAITSVTAVASQAAQLALVAQEGDVAVRTDLNQSYIRNAGTAGTMADWTLLATPADLVLSVAGKTGAVTLVKADVGLGNVDNTSDVNKPVSTAQQTALNAKLPTLNPSIALPLLLQARQLAAATALSTAGELAYDPNTGQLRYRDAVYGVDRRIASAYTDTQPAVRVRRSTNGVVTAGQWTPIGWDVEEYDTANMHDPVTNNSRLVAPVGGIYHVDATLMWDQTQSAGRRLIAIRVNGVDVDRGDLNLVTNTTAFIGTSATVKLNAGDYVEVYGYGDSAYTVQGGTPAAAQSFSNASMFYVASGQIVSDIGTPAARAYVSGGTQAVPAGQAAVILLPSEDYDSDSMHDLTTFTGRMTCRTPGVYRVAAGMAWNTTTGGWTRLVLLKNGSTLVPETSGSNQLSGQWHNVATDVKLAAGDYLELQAVNGSSGALNVSLAHFAVSLAATGKTVIPRARIYRSAAYSLPNGWSKVPLDAVDSGLDNDGLFDSANGRLACKTAGTYALAGQVTFTAPASSFGSQRLATIVVNGKPQGASHGFGTPNATVEPRANGSATVDLNVGDRVELWAYQDTGAALALRLTDDVGAGGVGNAVWLSAVKIGQSGPGANNDPGWAQSGNDLRATNSGKVDAPNGIKQDAVALFSSPVSLYSNGWRDYLNGGDASHGKPWYWKDREGVVHLEGLVDKNGGGWVANEVIATLPVGYRPAKRLIFGVFGSGSGAAGTVRVDVDTNGQVILITSIGTNPVGYLSLAGISFREASV